MNKSRNLISLMLLLTIGSANAGITDLISRLSKRDKAIAAGTAIIVSAVLLMKYLKNSQDIPPVTGYQSPKPQGSADQLKAELKKMAELEKDNSNNEFEVWQSGLDSFEKRHFESYKNTVKGKSTNEIMDACKNAFAWFKSLTGVKKTSVDCQISNPYVCLVNVWEKHQKMNGSVN
jgi:hypothetical protein